MWGQSPARLSGEPQRVLSLNSSSALVARAAISKVRSRPASSLDSPARAEPESHRRCPPFELFFDGRSRKKQRNSTLNTDRKNGFDERFWQKLNQKKQPGFLRGRVHIWFNTRLIRVDVEKQWTSILGGGLTTASRKIASRAGGRGLSYLRPRPEGLDLTYLPGVVLN